MELSGCHGCVLVLTVVLATVVELTHSATTAAPSINTCGTAVKDCLALVTSGSTDGCGVVSNQMECFSNTRNSNCTVDESQVTFDNFMPVFSDICNQVSNNSGSCWEFASCQLGTEYSLLVPAVNHTVGPTVEQINKFVSTAFWCTYTQQTLDCFLQNNVTCGFPQDAQTAIRSQGGWLDQTCSGQDTAVTRQCKTAVTSCTAANSNGTHMECSAQMSQMSCLSATRRQCNVNETIVTYDALSDVFSDVCAIVNPFVDPCFDLLTCLSTTDLVLMPGIATRVGPPTILYDQLLNTHFWCRHLQQTINCFLVKTAVCAVTAEQENSVDTTVEKLRNACAGDDGNAGFQHGTASCTMAAVTHLFPLLAVAVYFAQRSN